MARAARRQAESNIYHVMARGVGRLMIFEDGLDLRKIVDVLGRKAQDLPVEVLAWCLMSNHFHLLLRAEIDTVAKFMQRVETAYAQYFNEKTGREGHLFQGRFKSEPVDDEAYFLAVLRYIHQNPVKAGICPDCNYEWSSYREYLGQCAGRLGLASTDFAMAMFEGVDDFVEFHAHIPEERSGERKPLEYSEGSAPSDRVMATALADYLRRMGATSVNDLRRRDRNSALRYMRDQGAGVKQIQRVTGIGRNIVERALSQK